MSHSRRSDLFLSVKSLCHFRNFTSLKISNLLQHLLYSGCHICHPTDPFDIPVSSDDLSCCYRYSKSKLLHNQALQLKCIIPLSSSSSYSSHELTSSGASFEFCQPFIVSGEFIHPYSHLQAKSDWNCCLAVSSAKHYSVALSDCDIT